MTPRSVAGRGRGRPREFDTDEALEQAMEVFWANGYEATTLVQLTDAMGIAKPSLYAAFGDKAALHDLALARYLQRYGSHAAHLHGEGALAERLETWLLGVLSMFTSPLHPGCLVVNGICAGPALPETAREAIDQQFVQTRAFLTGFLREEQQRGGLPGSSDPSQLALTLLALVQGWAVLARVGTSPADLQAAARSAVAELLGS